MCAVSLFHTVASPFRSFVTTPKIMCSVLPESPDTLNVRLRFVTMHNINDRMPISSGKASSGNNTWPTTHAMAAASHSGLLSHKHVRRAQQPMLPWETHHMHMSRLNQGVQRGSTRASMPMPRRPMQSRSHVTSSYRQCRLVQTRRASQSAAGYHPAAVTPAAGISPPQCIP